MTDHSSWLEQQKGAWTRRLECVQDVIVEDVNKEMKRKDEEYQQELKNRDEQQQILSRRYHEEIIKNAHLVEEVNNLKRQVEKLERKKSPEPSCAVAQPEASLPKDGGSTVPTMEYHHLTVKLNDLHKKYQEAMQRMKYLERKNVAVMQKNKEMKDSVRAWQQYSDRHSAKTHGAKYEERSTVDPPEVIGPFEDIPPAIPSSPRSSFLKTPRSLVGLERSSPVPISLLSHVEYPVPDEVTAPPHIDVRGATHGVPGPDKSRLQSVNQLSKIPPQEFSSKIMDTAAMDQACDLSDQPNQAETLQSSQTTQDEVAQASTIAMQPAVGADDDDEPHFVSTRSLKRKRVKPARFEIYTDRVPSDGSPANPFRLKEEPLSSPPASTKPLQLFRKETLDLDELGPNAISTPHPRSRRRYSTVTGTLRHQRSTSVPIIKEEALEMINQRFPDNEQRSQRNPVDDDSLTGELRAQSEPFGHITEDAAPLQPLDPNVRTAEHVEEDAPNKRLKKDEENRLRRYCMLAESGEEPPPINGKYGRLDPEIARAKFNQKLKAGKNAQTPTKRSFKTPTTAPSRLQGAYVLDQPSSTTLPAYTPSDRQIPRKGAQSDSRSASRAMDTANTRPAWPVARKAVAPEIQAPPPLRSKPVSELKLSDFKANPAYNQGYSYAFAETVRKRSDRACLLGCTRSECCGSTFRALAAAAPALSETQEESLLEEYLGDAYDSMRLTQMSRSERMELILQARTRQMANKHGRHRHAYERHTTPPGFWRVEFPSTQEEKEDREKAGQMEREMVRERRAEALRNGRWIFRDE